MHSGRAVCYTDDALYCMQVLYHYFPKDVHLHNYSAANSHTQKMYNWHTLNSKVCSRLGFVIPNKVCDDAVRAKSGAIESVLKLLRTKIAELAGEYMPAQQQQPAAASQSAPLPQPHNHQHAEQRQAQAADHADTAPLDTSGHDRRVRRWCPAAHGGLGRRTATGNMWARKLAFDNAGVRLELHCSAERVACFTAMAGGGLDSAT